MKTIFLKKLNGEILEKRYKNRSDLEKDFNELNIKVGARAKVGEGAEVGARAKVGKGAKVGLYNYFFGLNLYKYSVSSYISKGEEWIQLGCFLRKRKDWEADFWNNTEEFPDDNSEKSNARVRAFKIACTFLDSIKK